MDSQIDKKETSHYIVYKIKKTNTVVGMVRNIEFFIDKKTNKVCRYYESMGNPFKNNALRMYYAFEYDERGRPSRVTLKKSKVDLMYGNVNIPLRQHIELSVQYQLQWDAHNQITQYVDNKGNWWDTHIMQIRLPFDLHWYRIHRMYNSLLEELKFTHKLLQGRNSLRIKAEDILKELYVSDLVEYIRRERNSLPQPQPLGEIKD
jgi:hypothetical protein